MERRTSRLLTLVAGILVLFSASIAILLKVIPGPHSNLDYLVIGAVATFLSMILLWIVLIQGYSGGKEEFPAKGVDDPAATDKPEP